MDHNVNKYMKVAYSIYIYHALFRKICIFVQEILL